ncbi:MAG TPA: AraC family transcriptional regulator [Puia sp.]|jgi:AraC-like DNA-binding protein|nr:AraC family transcriptional regulator [Puia sp.]
MKPNLPQAVFYLSGEGCRQVDALLGQLANTPSPERLSRLVVMLEQLSASADLCLLERKTASPLPFRLPDRLAAVHTYIEQNFLEPVSLAEAGRIAHMHTSAFCRYFKKRQGKTFIQVISEKRIRYACTRLLLGDSVTEACFGSGFNSVSSFTKTFKKVTGTSPRAYKKLTHE